MFPSLAARETCVAETNFAAQKQKTFLPEVKNIFVSRTQMLLSKLSHHENNGREVEVGKKRKKERNWKDEERELLIALSAGCGS